MRGHEMSISVTIGAGTQNINITGTAGDTTIYTDFGGADTYTVLNLVGDVKIIDNDSSIINLPPGLSITDALFLSDGVQFTINGFKLTMVGEVDDFSFVFGGTPLDPAAGLPKALVDTAEAFGTTLPEPGDPPSSGTTFGEISEEGGITPVTPSTDPIPINLADVVGDSLTAEAGVAEIFQLDFSIVDGVANSADVFVEITGFDVTEDVLRFNDTEITPATQSEFLDAAIIASNGFDDHTTISFYAPTPAMGSQIILSGIQDATLGGVNAFFEVV